MQKGSKIARSQRQLVIKTYQQKTQRQRGKSVSRYDKQIKSSGYTSPTVYNNFFNKSGVVQDRAFNQKQRYSATCVQRIFRGFLDRKQKKEKFVVYSCKYHQRNQDENQALILKIRLNRKDPQNPLIEFLVYCESSPRKLQKHKEQKKMSKKKFRQDSTSSSSDNEFDENSNLFKTFQISHPISETPYKDCRNEYECAILSKQFVQGLNGDMLNDFRKIRIENSKQYLQQHRRKINERQLQNEQLKPVKQAQNQDEEVSPNYIRDKKTKVHSAPVDKLLFNDQRQLYLQGLSPVRVKIFIQESGQNQVCIRGKLVMNGTMVPVQGTTRGKIMPFNMQQEKDDIKKKRAKVKDILVPSIMAKRIKGKGIGLYLVKQQSDSEKSSNFKSKRTSLDSETSNSKKKLPPSTTGQAYSASKFPPLRKPTTPKVKKSDSYKFEREDSIKRTQSIKQDRIIKKPKLMEKQAFNIIVKSRKVDDRSEDNVMHFSVEGYNQKRRKNYVLKDIPIDSTRTTKSQGQIAEIIYEKLEFKKPLRQNMDGQICFDPEKHVYQKKVFQDVFDMEEEEVKGDQQISKNQYEQDVFDKEEEEEEEEEVKEQSKKSEVKQLSQKGQSDDKVESEDQIKTERSEDKSQKKSQVKSSRKSSVKSSVKSSKKSSRKSSVNSVKSEQKEEQQTVNEKSVEKDNRIEQSPTEQRILSSNKRANTSSPSSLSSQKLSIKSSKQSSKKSSKKSVKKEQSEHSQQQKYSDIQSKIQDKKQFSDEDEETYRQRFIQQQEEVEKVDQKEQQIVQKEQEEQEPNKFQQNLLTKTDSKQNNVKIYIYKPNPQFEFKAIQNDKREIARSRVSQFELQDLFGQGIDEQNQDQIISLMQQKVPQYAQVDRDQEIVNFIPPNIRDNQKTIDQGQLSGEQKAKKMIDDLNPEDLSAFERRVSKLQRNYRNSVKRDIKKLKQRRPSRPPLITKGWVRLSDRYFQFSVYGQPPTKDQTEIIQVQLDFYNVNLKKIDTTGKKVSVQQMHSYTQKREGYYDLSYMIHQFVKKVAGFGQWLELPSFGDIIDSALEQR